MEKIEMIDRLTEIGVWLTHLGRTALDVGNDELRVEFKASELDAHNGAIEQVIKALESE